MAVPSDTPFGVHQARLARIAIGASAMRGQGNEGVVRASRVFLATLDLHPFSIPDEVGFATALDQTTDALLNSLPPTAQHWGLARKGLNLFLLDCLYSRHACERFNLQAAQQFFELPLDKQTGSQLCVENKQLPRWTTIRSLTPDVSDAYQKAALVIARSKGMVRVDLDALWWGTLDRDG